MGKQNSKNDETLQEKKELWLFYSLQNQQQSKLQGIIFFPGIPCFFWIACTLMVSPSSHIIIMYWLSAW